MDECPVRTEYQRDRDRIIHSKAFRRLKHKTQVFLSPEGDHFRTRLTHTLEVNQIARTMARGLRLNEDLVEAIAMGHDLGHTPFGHAGEMALTQALSQYHSQNKVANNQSPLATIPNDSIHSQDSDIPHSQSSTSTLSSISMQDRYDLYKQDMAMQTANTIPQDFEHNRQSLRVVDYLGNDGLGMNLTQEVRDGILHHTSRGKPSTLEGSIVHWADKIAYINHDIDDALRAGVLNSADIPKEFNDLFGNTTGKRINSMVVDFIQYNYGKNTATPSPDYTKAIMKLRKFMFDTVYTNKPEEQKAQHIILHLFDHFTQNLDQIPKEISIQSSSPIIKVLDYIASMTDNYAIALFQSLTIPKSKTQFDFHTQ